MGKYNLDDALSGGGLFSTQTQERKRPQPPGVSGYNEAQSPVKKKQGDVTQTTGYGNTQGKKGVKMPRLNLLLSEDVHEWISKESRLRGMSMAQLANIALEWYMDSPHSHQFTNELNLKGKEKLVWRINLGLAPEIYEWIKPEAKYRGLSASMFTDAILTAYLNSPEGHEPVNW